MTNQEIAQQILIAVGGKENVQTISHCMTRIRFKLNNVTYTDTQIIKKLPHVLTVVETAGQYQIVMGKQLLEIYSEIEGLLNPTTNEEIAHQKPSMLNRIFETIISIMTPFIGVTFASAVLKGLVSVAVATNILANDSSTFLILTAIADSILYYLPFLVALTASKRFKLSPYIGLALTAVLFAPSLLIDKLDQLEPIYLLFSGTSFELPVYFTFLGLPIVAVNYSGGLLPAIGICYFGSRVQKFLAHRIVGSLKHIFTPMIVVIGLAPFVLAFIGPATHLLGLGFLKLITSIITWSPLLAGLIMGGTWQILIASGLHWVLTPIFLLNMVNQGYDNLFVLTTATVFAQSGAVLGVMLKTKDRNLRRFSIPVLISGLFGITEPAIYGITLPRKSPFIVSCIVSGIGGSIIAILGVKKYVIYGFGLLTFPSLINPTGGNDWRIVLVMLICLGAFIATAAATVVFYREKGEEQQSELEKNYASEIIYAPQVGQLLSLEKAKNPIFASGVMGKGCVLQTQMNQIFAPINGEITAVFLHNSTIEMATKSGAKILLQIDSTNETLQMLPKVEKGDDVTKGDLLFASKDILVEEINCVIVILNSDKYATVLPAVHDKIKQNQPLLYLEAVEETEEIDLYDYGLNVPLLS